MYNFLVENPVVAIIFGVLVVALAVFLLIKVMQNVGLEKVREIAYQGFLSAEHKFKEGENSQKFDYVVDLVRGFIPNPFKMFITENLLRKVIQTWFNLVKDLLDDGKLNNTIKEVEVKEQ